MHPYEELLFDHLSNVISDIPETDVYVIWIEYSSQALDDDELGLDISFHYNTDSYRKDMLKPRENPDEVTWSSAYWKSVGDIAIHNFIESVDLTDHAKLLLQNDWLKGTPIPTHTYDEDGKAYELEEDYQESQRLENATKTALVEVVKALHSRGVIKDKFGRAIPIMIGYHENTPEDAELTRLANPERISKQAEEWMIGRTYEQIDAISALDIALSKKSTAEQADYWIELLKDLELVRSSDAKAFADHNKLTKFNIEKRLYRLDSNAVSKLIELVKEFVFNEEYIGRTPIAKTMQELATQAHADMQGILEMHERKKAGLETPEDLIPKKGWTSSNNLTGFALNAITQIGSASDAEVSELYSILNKLYAASIGTDWVGTNLVGVARTLHALRPNMYPIAHMGSSDNKLLNYKEFGQ